MKSRATVLDALALAQGLTEFADRRRIVVLRHEGTALKRIRFDYDDSVSESGASPQSSFVPATPSSFLKAHTCVSSRTNRTGV